ncbi:MAG: GHKL domain-containing protein [Bacteroidales bacterium]|nr:GHKL domain-containing protein [Bacteroidales bacterium]
MSHNLKPAARLTIIFVLAIILSGSVLAYFSINNISNLKDLTEKKILEEQRVLSDRVLNAISTILENVTTGLNANKVPLTGLREKLVKRAGEYSFVRQSFIIQKNGQFIHPNFSNSLLPVSGIRSPEKYVSSFTAGETAEFAEHDLRKARSHYLAGLRFAARSSDSARALNALGRVAVKMTDYENAIAHYSLIITDYPQVTDESGLAYSLYALPQLLSITDQDNYTETLQAVRLNLEKMADGTIPLYYSTEELLGSIPEYLKKTGSEKQGNAIVIDGLSACLQEQIRFILVYGEELKGLVAKVNSDHSPSSGNEFFVEGPASGMINSYFLINSSAENHIGFLIDSEKLLDTVLTMELQSGLEFEHIINFPASFSRYDAANDRLVNRSQLNPFFPGHTMVISLSNETLINDIVRRRAWIYGIAFLLLLGSMLLGVVLILRDIAREKHLARLRADFISNVTHELKTPLTSIRMYAESLILGRVKSPEGQKEYLSVMVNETDRLKRMINNILEFSKMEKGKPEYHIVRTNLASLVREAMNEMKYWFEREQFAVTTDLDEDIFAEVDTEKMKQAVGNLLSNAIKYSADLKEISVRVYRGHDHVCVEVSDRGIGIAEEELLRIFEEFYRVEQREGASGTGLGLTVVKEIVNAHNGKITVTSEVGKGSKFVILLKQQSGNSENNPGN